eukprot:6497290-Alexandrium_andersonii.AAC.1
MSPAHWWLARSTVGGRNGLVAGRRLAGGVAIPKRIRDPEDVCERRADCLGPRVQNATSERGAERKGCLLYTSPSPRD